MKVSKKTLSENILAESGRQAGDYFEIGAADWLNKTFSNTGYVFSAIQDTGHGDIKCNYDGDTKFLIECKLGTAQAGQMSLKKKLNDDGTEVIEFDYDRNDNTPLGKLISQILALINKTYSNSGAPLGARDIEWKGIKVDNIHYDSDGDVSIEADVSEDNNLFQLFVKQEYLDNKPSTKFFLYDTPKKGLAKSDYADLNNISPHICLTRDIDKVYDMSAKVRLKIDADPLMLKKVDDSLKSKLLKAFGGKDLIGVDASKGEEAYIVLDNKLNVNSNYRADIDGITYQLNTRNDSIKNTESGVAQQVRFIKNNRVIFIITLTLTKEGSKINQVDEFIRELNKYKDIHEGLDMRKNLSEELIINDDISLGSLDHDDEECKKELAKEIEKNEKEVSDELANRVEEVEEINNAEAPELELHDANDKKIRIKGLTEKLILEEPADTLNEDWEDWTDDDYFERYSNTVRKVHDVLLGFIRECRDYMHEIGEDQFGAAESICDEALYHLEDLKDEFGEITEEVLDEKIPNDLAKAYKKYNYKGRSGGNTDLENANYTVIDDPAEAYKIYKQDPKSIRLLFGSDLIDFRDDGRPSDVHRDTWLGNGKEFVNRNGKVVRDSMYVPPKELIKRADKIYVTNEHTPEGKKDQAKLAARRENPESPNSNVASKLRSYSYGKRHYWNNDERRGDASRGDAYDRRSLNNYKDTLQGYERRLAQADQSGDYGWRGRDRMVQDIEDAKRNVFNQQGRIKDNAARRRYANSELALQKPLERFVELKGNINQLQDMVDDSARDLEAVRREGSPSSRRNKEKLRELQRDMLELRKRIAAVELDLEETDEEDAKAIEAAERKYSSAQSEYNNARVEIDRLLRRNN